MTPKTLFKNFVPTDSLQIYANSLVGQITQKAPYDSITFSCIEKINDSYLCRIEIVSALGRFIGIGSAGKSHIALERAKQKVNWQISKWLKKRVFHNLF